MILTICLVSMDLNNIKSDILVVDYTEYCKSTPYDTTPSRGVCFIENPDERLGVFCILNPNHVSYKAINLEETKTLVTDNAGNSVKQCECICEAYRRAGRRWILLLELKYCKEENISSNMLEALDKLEKCYDFLNNEKDFFKSNLYRVYLCASHPEHETIEPFGRFICNQDKLLRLKDKGLIFIYKNAIKIHTPEYITGVDTPYKYKRLSNNMS